MGKITKALQAKHKDTLSPWLKNFVQDAASTPLPLIPKKLEEFPTRWPFPRGDLYHWIPLLNRFDNILECLSKTYGLTDPPNPVDFECNLLLKKVPEVEYHDDHAWDMQRLKELGYNEQGDIQLVVAILDFTCMLLQHCGNRSIYASSAHLNDLLQSSSLEVLKATLQVGHQLAQRYQASVKRVSSASQRNLSGALLNNHYNIDLERVQTLAQPFVKTPMLSFPTDPFPATPNASASKGKDKVPANTAKNVATTTANDLVAVVQDQPEEGRWNGWGDVKVLYYTSPASGPEGSASQPAERGNSSTPATPTPLRRSNTAGPQHRTPRGERSDSSLGDDGSSPASQGRSPAVGADNASSNQHQVHFSQNAVASTPIYELMSRCPADMPKTSRYEVLNRLRVAKALLGTSETRQLALAVRLLAITNLAYIHPEPHFIEKALKCDNDEPRRYQLTYQLVELIHPSTVGASPPPLWLQSIALQLLEGICGYPTKYPDVLSALNANVNHGVLLYVLRKAVAGMKEDDADETGDRHTEADEWRSNLFSLALNMAQTGRAGTDAISSGMMEIMVEILKLRSSIAQRHQPMVLAFLDNVTYAYPGAFQAFVTADGLTGVSQLIIDTTESATALTEQGKGTHPDAQSVVVDYEIPYYQQQTLKWLLKFVHHIMTNSYTYGGNIDRLLRNLVDNSQLLQSLRTIVQHVNRFGSVVWTHAVTILGDFINNDPTSFNAILESGTIHTFLESLTGRKVDIEQPKEEENAPAAPVDPENPEESPSSPPSDGSVVFEDDDRNHPPSEEELNAPRPGPLARGILPSSEAMGIIPNILNALSLNNTGMTMVAKSRVFETYLEIFESPAHVRCMAADREIPSNIGATFDELGRHHPALRTVVSNAVLDLVARVKRLGHEKAASGCGATLRISQGELSSKGKGKETGSDDIDMVDADQAAIPISTARPNNGTAATEGDEDGITPYIAALVNFLHAYLGNANLRSSFVTNGGTELVLDLCQLPSLPCNFFESSASRTLQHVVSQLIEKASVLGLPSLLNRTQAAVEALQPLLSTAKGSSYFGPFILDTGAGIVSNDARAKHAEAAKVVQGLLNAEILIKILCHSFPQPVRQGHTGLHPVNVFDYFVRLINTLGPLLYATPVEEAEISNLVPRHWRKMDLDLLQDSPKNSEDAVPGTATPAAAADDTVPSSLQDFLRHAKSDQSKKVTAEEESSDAYRNFTMVNGLLHAFRPCTVPLFQTLGKVLLPRRERDPYVRSRHLQIADALAELILGPLSIDASPTVNDYQYLWHMLSILHKTLIDQPKSGERSPHIIVPVLLAFKERGGIGTLNHLLVKFIDEINGTSGTDSVATKSRWAAMCAKTILELYSVIVNSKNITESNAYITMNRSSDRVNDNATKFIPQLIVELRMDVLPTVRGIWASGTVEKLSTSILSKVVEILKTIAAADSELGALLSRGDSGVPPTLFKLQNTPFNWFSFSNIVTQLTELNGDEELAREATYRAMGDRDRAGEYSRCHGSRHLAGARNPIPEEDAYKGPPRSENASRDEASAVPADAMVLDPNPPDIDRLLGEAVLGELDHSSHDSSEDEQDEQDEDDDDEAEDSAPQQQDQPAAVPDVPAEQPPAGSSEESAQAGTKNTTPRVCRQDLDDERAKIQEDLIDRCLEVIQAHPDSVYELADLITTTVLKSPNVDSRQEIGETLVNALLSFAIDEETKKSSARSIAAYAHLLCILLQDSQLFFRETVASLRDSINETMDFLKLPPGNTSEELPPWLPYILLIFEILLIDDQQLPEITWKAPKSETDEVEPVVFAPKELIVGEKDRAALLETILDMLPRIGKDEMLAVAALRILVILTRDRSVARTVGDKKNLQRLFVMAKQLSGAGSARFKETRIGANIMLILRHIVEDEDTIRQIMRYEIKSHFDNPRTAGRLNDASNYLRAMSHIALRAPILFVEVTNDMCKFASHWVPESEVSPRNAPNLALKESVANPAATPNPPKDDSVEPAVQGTEDLNINDVRPSTETGDKEVPDVPKTPAFDHKRPIVENPDGVINFLLEQLLNYQRVEDAEVSQQPKEQPKEDKSADASTVSTPAGPSSGATAAQAEADGSQGKDKEKDKKPAKSGFKAEEHPIFIYRCFLLSCLTELLQSYNRTKIEFINFKRGAVLQTNTPVKPRSSVLNYLLNDLLCISSLTSPADTVASKKKAATAEQARFALTALVTKTSEKPIDRTKDRFEYDDEPDLLFVRKFVLDMILRAYKDAATSNEAFDVRYAKMLSIAELMNHMIGEKNGDPQSQRLPDSSNARSQMQLKRLMYEKGYLGALTTSIADIDLTFPGVKRTIKYILRVLRVLSSTAIYLSRSSVALTTSVEDPEDDIHSNSSLSDMTDDREETPDLYRNSALGMLEPQEDDYQDGSEDDDDEEMYEDEYDDEMDYGDAMSEDGEEDISDEDEELGEIEGLSGDPNVVEVIMGEDEDESMHDDDDDDEDDEEDSDDDEDDDDEDDDEVGSEDMEVLEEQIDMIGAGGAEVLDDGWEDEASDEQDDDAEQPDFEAIAQDLDEGIHPGMGDADLGPFENVVRALEENGDLAFDPDDEEIQRFEEHYLEEGGDEDEDEDDDNEIEDEEFVYDPRDGPPPAHMPPGLGWDTLVVDQAGGNHRHRHGGIRSPFPPFVFGRGDPSGRSSHNNTARGLDVMQTTLERLRLQHDQLERQLASLVTVLDSGPSTTNRSAIVLTNPDFRSFFGPRHGRGGPPPNAPDDGVNPLLRRGHATARDSSPRPPANGLLRVAGLPQGLLANGNFLESPLELLNSLIQGMPNMGRNNTLHFQITQQGPRGEIRELNVPYNPSHPLHSLRDARPDARRDSYQEPHQAVAFLTSSTYDRWLDEARMVFGASQPEKASRMLANRINALLTPAALQWARDVTAAREEREKQLREEREKRDKEAKEKAERERKEAEEKEREKKAAEEKERLEREAVEAAQAAEAAARAAEEAPAEIEAQPQEPQPMEGIETSGAADQEQAPPAPATEETARIMTTIRGETIDVTDLGIDPDYLAALPEEFREEVITGTLTARRSEARAQADNTGDQSEILNEFLAALPEDMRQEIVQHERQETRRREREEMQRAATATGHGAIAQEMDAGSILATLDADLRNQILLEQGEELLDQLPPDMAAQAAAMRDRHRARPPQFNRTAREAIAARAPAPAAGDNKVERRTVVQMLDKAGIATLLRLMFITQQGSIRSYLFSVLTDVCENRQNRVEVVSTLLQILQEGSTDMDAVERSFGHLSLKARQPKEKEGKTPNSLKRTFTNISASTSLAPTSDISPLLIVQQCLDLLVELSTKNLHIPSLFLTEHEIVGSTLKRAFAKKGKGKFTQASKYAINSLLSLLDRALIMESSSVMQLLVDLLNKVTYPLQALERRRKEAIEEEKKEAEKKDEPAAESASTEQAATTAGEAQSEAPAQPEPAAEQNTSPDAPAQAEASSSTAPAQDTKAVEKKKARQLQPPVIPVQNLTLVVNIFVARECSSKTFQNTISTIKNLSNIPGAKQVFGEELVRQARKLSENIVSDLNELLPHILKAETGTEIQGIALAKFSPGASEQNKLLRVLTALDHLFDSKKKSDNESADASESAAEKFDFLDSLGNNSTFGTMWEKLSDCLSAIKKRENMLNVATILLPLIESLMVVCKNTTSLTEPPASQSQAQKDMVMSSPPPEDRTASLFFSFTEDHRRILNELVRHNPKLMSGTFSLLVKNPKVLEFDNKRNYFNRSVHAKINNQGRSSFPPLQLSVRRDQVFHDSFKSLYFKSGDEMKYGKLSIRFHGEEGVDAGGVSREWFQVLARQMFDPNYVLFEPVKSDASTFHPNKASHINDEHLMFFKFIGRVIGKALYEGRLLDCYFSRAVYKRILGEPVSVKDMESHDPEYYKSLLWMLENDITNVLTETFSIEDEVFGATTTVDLCENGRNIPVTDENKHEFAKLAVEHKLLSSVKDQMEHFLKGFHDIIPADLIAIFNEQELELLISGLPDIDIDDWKGTTEYHNYTAASQQIQWFWRAVRSFDKEERAKLLQFVTGTSKVPLNGFKELEGMNGISRFNIHRDYGNKERLPSSHTCFNQLDLPEYESYDALRGQLLKAITAGNDYFGFA